MEVLAGARVRVLSGDAIESLRSLPDQCVDAIVTDPPYCAGGFSETARRNSRGMLTDGGLERAGWFAGDAMGTPGLAWLLRMVAVEAARIVRPGGSLTLFADWRMVPSIVPAVESAGLSYRNQIVWAKPNPALGTGFRTQHELALHFAAGPVVYHDRGCGNVISAPRVSYRRRQHPTEKPVELLQRILSVVCPPGGIVCDPFAGSGSTGVAALRLGMRALLVERSPAFVAVAEARVAAELQDAA